MPSLKSIAASLAVLASAVNGNPLEKRFTVGQTVQTSSGPVKGHVAPLRSGVSEYLGIPYAAPPLGNLRFAPPEPYQSNGSTIVAAEKGLSCSANGVFGGTGVTGKGYPFHSTVQWGPQGISNVNTIGGANLPTGEDCLTLNVWTKPQTGDKAKAILLWIYGGGFGFGTSNITAYDGQFQADQNNVVVVTINYRVNIFGFPGAPNTRQNLGLLDQRLAVQWVRDNAAAFGGDPTRITMFGQSAGGASLDYYSFAWYNNDPIVAGFIQESGTILGIAPQDAAYGEKTWYGITKKLGCGNSKTDQAAVLACMRNKTEPQIKNALSAAPGLASVINSLSFQPIVDNITAFANYTQLAAEGKFMKVPLLNGNTDGEADIVQPTTKAMLGLTFPPSILDYATKVGFTCATGVRSNVSLAQGIPTWRYRWFGVYPNEVIAYNPSSGVYHSTEITAAFNSGFNFPTPNTANETLVSNYISGAWAAFAKNPANGLNEYGWVQYDASKPTLLQLATPANPLSPNPTYASVYDTGCPSNTPAPTLQGFFDDILALLHKVGINL